MRALTMKSYEVVLGVDTHLDICGGERSWRFAWNTDNSRHYQGIPTAIGVGHVLR